MSVNTDKNINTDENIIPQGSVAKLIIFSKSVFRPGNHLLMSGLWFLGLYGSLAAAHGHNKAWWQNPHFLLDILSIFFLLFFLRVADEIKDYEYDLRFNPDRPLIKGSVIFRDLYAYLGITAALIILFGIGNHLLVTLVLVLDMLYGLLLIWIEKKSDKIKNGVFLNLLFTYPVNIAVSIFVFMVVRQDFGISMDPVSILLIVAFELAFLYYEVSRKTSWVKSSGNGKRLYSNEIGSIGSFVFALVCALAPVGILFGIFKPWQSPGVYAPWAFALLPVPVIIGAYRFLRARNDPAKKDKANIMMPYALKYLMLFYILQILCAVL